MRKVGVHHGFGNIIENYFKTLKCWNLIKFMGQIIFIFGKDETPFQTIRNVSVFFQQATVTPVLNILKEYKKLRNVILVE